MNLDFDCTSNSSSENVVDLETSVNILKSKIRNILPDAWFPGEGADFVSPKTLSPIQDVVLFGNFFSQLTKIHLWPKHHFRLWVLSTAVRECIHFFLGIPKEQIGVLKRTELFSLLPEKAPLTDLNRPWELVYGGRLSLAKNLGLLLKLVSCLQYDYRLPVHLKILGSFDQVGRDDLGLEDAINFKEQFWQTLNSLPFVQTPEVIENLGPQSWLDHFGERSLFISLSQFYMEDFGVALAQVHERGGHSIVSHWGGHLDAPPTHSKFLRLTLPQYLNRQAHDEEARRLAKKIATFEFDPPQAIKTLPHPQHISQVELKEALGKFILAFGPEVLSLGRPGEDEVIAFSKTQNGRRFFHSYHCLFSGVAHV